MTTESNTLTYIKLLLMAFFWGGTFIAGRLLAGEVPPFSAAFLRFAIASLILLYLTRRHCGTFPRVHAGQRGPLLVLGASGVFAYNAFFFSGLELIEAGRAAVIIANNPIFIGLFAALLFKEKLTLKRLSGISLSILGAVIVITHGAPLSVFTSVIGRGEVLIFGCVASWVIYSLVGRSAMKRLSPLVAVTYSATLGALLLFPAAVTEGLFRQMAHYPLSAWGSLSYLAVCGTVLSFVWYYQGIRKIGATRAGQFINFVPVSAVLLSVVILQEPLTSSLLTGLLMVSCGVCLTNESRGADRRQIKNDPHSKNKQHGC